MIEHQFWTHLKLASESSDTLDIIVAAFRPLIDPHGWDNTRHGTILKNKIRAKINRIRSEMVRDGELVKDFQGTYQWRSPDDTDKTPDAFSGNPVEVQQTVAQMRPAVRRQTLFNIFNVVGEREILDLFLCWRATIQDVS